MPADDAPLWIEAAVLTALLAFGLLGGAYEYALVEASRTRITNRLLKGGVSAKAFIERAAANDKTISARTGLFHALAAGAFVIYGLWVLLPAGQLSFSLFCRVGAILLLVQVAVKGVAKLLGEYLAEDLVIKAAPLMRILTLPAAPFAWIAVWGEKTLSRAFDIQADDEDEELEAEVIDAVADGQLDGVVEDGQKEMIEGIFEFKDADVADIIVPRTEMTTVDSGASLTEAVHIALHKGYLRLPAYKGTRDHIVGIFHVRDVLPLWNRPEKECPQLASILRPPLFVPETKKIPELLAEMRRGESHMAIVLDEYGGTAGLVTIEDVLEEIVGDIQDEFDSSEDAAKEEVRRLDDESLEAEGQAHVAEVNKLLGEELIPEDDDYETVAGFVLDNLGHIPEVGETFDCEGKVAVKVLQADERRVRRVHFELLHADE